MPGHEIIGWIIMFGSHVTGDKRDPAAPLP